MPLRRPTPHLRRFASLPLEDLACVALFCFFALQGAIPFIAPAQSQEMTASAPSSLTTIGGIASQALANALILVLLLRRPRHLLRDIADLPWLILPGALAALAVVSTTWSLEPLLTLRRSLPFALAGLFGAWFASRYPLPRQLAILRLAMILLALGTIALVVLDPSLGLDHSPGHEADWQGLFTQKNACGRMMVLATAILLCEPGRTLLRPSRLASLALFFFVLLMSGSRGAWMIEAALLLLFLLLSAARRSSQRVRLILALAAPLATLALGSVLLLDFHRFALVLGRDPTLTGRTAIWSQVAHFIQQRPLAGYGYDAFWRGMQGPSLQIAAAVHFVVAHAHNGFLEMALELGSAGLLLFALSWLRGWLALWPLWQRGKIELVAWPLTVLILIVLYDLDENTLLIYNGLFWPLFVCALVTAERLSKPALSKLRAQRGARRMGDPRHTAFAHAREILNNGRKPAAQFAESAQELS